MSWRHYCLASMALYQSEAQAQLAQHAATGMVNAEADAHREWLDDLRHAAGYEL